MPFANFAAAQLAPAGNAHPQTRLVGEGEGISNPFGASNSDPTKVPTQHQKAEFAAKVDLESLRDLAVLHNGRVKVLDTLARETVFKLTGKRRFVERPAAINTASPGPGGAPTVGQVIFEKVKYDPLFTLLDLSIDPQYYVDKPIIGIDYLNLRRELLEAAFPGDEEKVKHELKAGGVSPLIINAHAGKVASKHPGEEQWARALGEMDQAIGLYVGASRNWDVVAPASKDQAWVHLSRLPEDAPARKAALALGAAWRGLDAAAANAAIATLAAELPKINAEVYPGGRRSLELTYNKANAFEWGFWAYCVSLVALLLAFGTGRKWLAVAGSALLVGAVGLHAFGFITRCIIAERFAIQNQFESMTGVSLFAAALGLVVMLVRRQWLFGAAAAAVGFMVLITATQAGIPGQHIEREAAILNTSVLLKYHVTTVLVSYGLIALGFVCSLFYLGAHYFGSRAGSAQLASGTGGRAASGTPVVAAVAVGDSPTVPRAKLLQDLDTAQMIVLQLAFWTLGVGILLGAWWADHSWGRWWAFDPKETWALLTWIIYLIVIHVRVAAPAKKGLTTAWLSVVGFIVMLWTYFGVNLLLPGLHAYA
ncbi:MAG TPA: cytochrome c biogenesis protein CcsA [Phycisphaerales bacterium]|nr:cytochrome c biogenesis protein CcsA [Phycisphaerales bacterium]